MMEAHLLEAAKGTLYSPSILVAFDRAIEDASCNGYDHDAALGSQLAAKYCLSVMQGGIHKDSMHFTTIDTLLRWYLQQAIDLYKSWGAIALVNHLENKHGSFLIDATVINFPEGISDPYLSSVRTDPGYFDSHIPYVGHSWPTTYTTALYDCGHTSNGYILSADKLPSLLELGVYGSYLDAEGRPDENTHVNLLIIPLFVRFHCKLRVSSQYHVELSPTHTRTRTRPVSLLLLVHYTIISLLTKTC